MFDLFEAKQTRELKLRDYQEEAIDALRNGIRRGMKRQVLVAPTGAGKCLGRGTPILMANGTIKPVEQVRVGDRLASPTGNPCTVLSLARGIEQMFQVTPTKGDSYTCNASHLLSLKKSGPDGMILANGEHILRDQEHVVCRADTLFASNNTAKHCLKGWRGTVHKFENEVASHPMPPYIFGVWLGDGSKRLDRCAITKPVGQVVSEWCKWAKSIGCRVRKDDIGGRCPTWFAITDRGQENPSLDALRKTLVDPEYCDIPLQYKTATFSARQELLAGILDTDGSVSRGGWDYISKYENLARDTAFLARSIGLAAYVSECEKGIAATGFVGKYWRVSISGDSTLVPCRIKVPAPRRTNKDPLRHGITLEPSGIGEYFGFELDGDRLFMLGDFTVTHNTVIASHLLREADRKGSYALFLVDRVSLVDQTSATLDDYGIPHGVIQGDHPRWEPRANVQVCSIQTLNRRSLPRRPALICYDECHVRFKATMEYMDSLPDCVKVGLTATPFTAGMGEDWDRAVNVRTTRSLIDGGHLIEPTIYVAKSPDDSQYTRNKFGEFSESSAANAGIEIVGDVASEWVGKVNEHFGGPVKTIVFAATVEHGRELCSAFAAVGQNFQQISYLDKDEDERRAKIAEFRKPDSEIMGLVSCGVLTRGFDVTDVQCGISCRPYRKSLSSHMQEIGRVMRPHGEGKRAIWLDHSGNIERFAIDMFDVWEHGAGELSHASKHDSKPRERTQQEREKVVCPECSGALRGNTCMGCGWERPARSGIVAVEGELQEFSAASAAMQPRAGLRAECLKEPRRVWEAALCYTFDRSRKGDQAARKWAYGIFRGIYPDSKLPFGWFDLARPNNPAMDAYSLIEREVKRYRKTKGKAA